ncbi:carbohydrate porin [Brevundimonas subvibrioides]|uniref:Carbohydrate-selective porin OprB n=1 Tax=Brevundimonas subvibrioides (strain ATCC 15264 / DSM 4735 / LMG 14903 / NBRC 16000 / CB 81) TaxID=633149 RepID=D9QFQ8_BRESC|nr:carbohydrate porin [Brevundimonas subvibrioides]ADL00622.1 Carbohydrate-selective porin OprB [Brevundimonas subvibrioides ATCC 15264]
MMFRLDDVRRLIWFGAMSVGAAASPALAGGQDAGIDPAWVWDAAYTADVIGVVAGDAPRAGRYLDDLSVGVDGDLERQFGWTGTRVHFSFLANHGGEPNAVAGTLQGYDNIEVAAQKVRLYEAWVEHDVAGAGSVLAGLYDVNSEFYVTGTSDLLLAPPFGTGSELASTGPNGPAIFPSTALAVRLRVGAADATYVQVAAVNARAGTIGDVDGVDTTLDDGLLYLAEAGRSGPVRIAAGVWRYGETQPDIRRLAPSGDPARSRAQGAYLLAEGTVVTLPQGGTLGAFARVGVSDGDTTDFRGGWQAGLRLDSVMPGRPDSALSLGVHQGLLSDKARANAVDAGTAFARAESGIELTYADTLGPFTIQPDLQWIHHPGGEQDRDPILIAGVRFIWTVR